MATVKLWLCIAVVAACAVSASAYQCGFGKSTCQKYTGYYVECGLSGGGICCAKNGGSSGSVQCANNVPQCDCATEASWMSVKLAEKTQSAWTYMGAEWSSSVTLSVARNEKSFLALVLDPDYRYKVTARPSNTKDPMATVFTYVCTKPVEEFTSCYGRGNLGTVNSFTVCTGTLCEQSFEETGYQELLVHFQNNNGFFQGKLDLKISIARTYLPQPTTTVKPTTRPSASPTGSPTNTIFPSPPTPRPTSSSVPVTEPASVLQAWEWALIVAAGVIVLGVAVAMVMAKLARKKVKQDTEYAGSGAQASEYAAPASAVTEQSALIG